MVVSSLPLLLFLLGLKGGDLEGGEESEGGDSEAGGEMRKGRLRRGETRKGKRVSEGVGVHLGGGGKTLRRELERRRLNRQPKQYGTAIPLPCLGVSVKVSKVCGSVAPKVQHMAFKFGLEGGGKGREC